MTHGLLRSIFFRFEFWTTILFLVSNFIFYCVWRTWFVWFPPKIFELYFMAQVIIYLGICSMGVKKRICILLLLDGVIYKCQYCPLIDFISSCYTNSCERSTGLASSICRSVYSCQLCLCLHHAFFQLLFATYTFSTLMSYLWVGLFIIIKAIFSLW